MQQNKYSSYQEYVGAQDSRSHNLDDERGRFLYKMVLAILRAVTGMVPKMIFDIGCRDACWSDDFKREGIGYYGIDISPKSIAYAKGRGRNVECVDADNARIPEGTDCVIMSHSIEHLLNPEVVLSNVFTQTSENAVVIVKCPVQPHGLRKGEKAHAWAWNLQEVSALLSKKWQIRLFLPLRGEWFFILDKQSKSVDPTKVCEKMLQEVPEEDREVFAEIMKNDWLKKKINRTERLHEKLWYLGKYFPELKKGERRVLDIGCGPGEFLEWCRYFYNIGIGIDTPNSPMSNRYGDYSRILNKAQGIDVRYTDFMKVVTAKDYSLGKFEIIHSQGAINQIMTEHILWESPHVGSWKCDKKCRESFDMMFDWFRRSLVSGGQVMIYANGSKNDDTYSLMVREVASKHGFKTILNYKNIMHKWLRIDR